MLMLATANKPYQQELEKLSLFAIIKLWINARRNSNNKDIETEYFAKMEQEKVKNYLNQIKGPRGIF